jgi:hypothetical protein
VSTFNLEFNIKTHYRQVLLLSLLLSSLFIDHFTTHVGISNGLYETNSNVIYLINNNLWLITDLLITFLIFYFPIFIKSFYNNNHIIILYLLPITATILRFFVCINNILLLLTI